MKIHGGSDSVSREVGIADLMRAARTQGVVIPAFNIPYIPIIESVAKALKAHNCVGMVEVARPDIRIFQAESYARIADEFNRFADRRLMRLHQDHTPVIDEVGERVDWEPLVEEALEAGYDSVMVDGSRLPLEENIRVIALAVEIAHPRGVPVEAELGAVMGHEPGPAPSYEELYRTGRGFTRIEDAQRFVRETGVDWLSVAIGNVHGAIFGEAKDRKKIQARLNIEHLKKLRQATGVPLVLHGGSGIARQSVREAIANGIAKVNVGTEIRQTYERALVEHSGQVARAQMEVQRLIEAYLVEDYQIEDSATQLYAAVAQET